MRYFSLALLACLWISNTAFALGGSTCVEATVVGTLPYTDSGQLDSGFDPNCPGAPVNDLFYVFIAPNSGTFRFDMCGSNSCCDQLMRIWTDGTCCGGASVAVSSGCVDGYPLYDLAMTSGQVVYIEVGKSGIEWAIAPNYVFNVADVTPPAGGTCESAITVGSLPYSDSGQLESGINDDCPGGPANDFFYYFVAPASGSYRFDMCGSVTTVDFQMKVSSLNGTCCSEAVVVDSGCADGNPQFVLYMYHSSYVFIEIGITGDPLMDPPTFQFHVTPTSGSSCDDPHLISNSLYHYYSLDCTPNFGVGIHLV